MSEHVHGHGGRSAPGPFGCDHGAGNSGFHFEWPDLPPTFEGSTTSLPSQPLVPQRIHRQTTMPDKAGPPSSDVLAAASMLYQNGMNGNDYSSTFTSQIFTENGLEDLSSHQAHIKQARYGLGEENRRLRFNSTRRNHTYTDTAFPPKAGPDTESEPAPHKEQIFGPLRWGSDAGFAEQGYQVPADQPTMEERTTEILHNLECFESQSSAPNTRPSSPNPRRRPGRNGSGLGALRSPDSFQQSSPIDRTDPDDETRPSKRRKNKGRLKDEEDDYLQPSLGRPSNSRRDRRWSSNSGAQSRRSKIHVIKPPRENLSEEQKRANHILSEQKRRNLIKQGFDELCGLVPDLRGGGFSKSTMLAQAGDWLQDLLEGNEILKHQLEDLKAQTGG
ncbi:predicted protein [Uncinocarpus reesii 1704]|uniref:BHLH domain-containing protein n=1 Tax=Uncinocarpus reesii (strain UAMH 1704) TaxID=336963 RepID=C4JXM4_UNCRE|nr:uncharacterized protein UREG_06397 [Uncinocarpus reesii 1704]EEP81532.1 predicted protein [Uncinocarpus reesii 1704]